MNVHKHIVSESVTIPSLLLSRFYEPRVYATLFSRVSHTSVHSGIWNIHCKCQNISFNVFYFIYYFALFSSQIVCNTWVDNNGCLYLEKRLRKISHPRKECSINSRVFSYKNIYRNMSPSFYCDYWHIHSLFMRTKILLFIGFTFYKTDFSKYCHRTCASWKYLFFQRLTHQFQNCNINTCKMFQKNVSKLLNML